MQYDLLGYVDFLYLLRRLWNLLPAIEALQCRRCR